MSNTVVTSSQLFYNKLNEANPQMPVPFTPDNVVVGVPQVNNNGSVSKNSMITVSGAVGSPYSGIQTAYYDRVSMADILATAPNANSFRQTTETMISDVLPIFNQTFLVNMVADDIIDGPLPASNPTTGQIAFTLAAAATSLAFMGSIPITYVPDDISLTTFPSMVISGLSVGTVNGSSTSPWQTLLTQISANNSSITRLLSTGNVTEGTPTALTGDASGKNTSVAITGVQGSGFKDQATFYYNRLSLAALVAASANPSDIVPNTGQVTLADLVASFNSQYGAKLAVADLVPTTLGAISGGYMGATLTPVAGHPLYNAGQQIMFKQSFPTLTVTGTFATPAPLQTAYSSTLALAGGDGTYLNPRVHTGSLPLGLNLSIVGSTVKLSGSPTTAGTSSFTIAVDSDDGQTAYSTTQSIVVVANLATALTNPISTGLVTADATGKTALNALLARINADNPTLPVALSSTTVALGTPTALTGDASGKDTSIVLSKGSTNDYSGSVTVKYNRIDLTTLLGAVSNSISWAAALVSSSDLLNAFNTATGAQLAAVDIVVEALPTNPLNGSTVSYTLKANANSLAFEGSVVLSLVSVVYTPLSITGTLNPNATIGTAYSSSLTINGGTPPYVNPVLTGGDTYNKLPAGLSMSISGNTLTVSGTPTGAISSANLFISVSDSASTPATATSAVQGMMTNAGVFALLTPNSAPDYSISGSAAGGWTALRTDATSNYEGKAVYGIARTKNYFEFVVGTSYISPQSLWIAFGATDGASSIVSSYFSYEMGGGTKWVGGASTTGQTKFFAGDVVNFAIDATNKSSIKIWMGRNGAWFGGGNPATGTLPYATLGSLPSPGFYTGHGTYNSWAAQSLTVNTAPASLKYAPPAGFASGITL